MPDDLPTTLPEAPGYSWRNIFDKEPAAIASALRLVLVAVALTGEGYEWFVLPTVVILGIVAALEGLLTLFIRSKSTPTVTVEQRVEEAKLNGIALGQSLPST